MPRSGWSKMPFVSDFLASSRARSKFRCTTALRVPSTVSIRAIQARVSSSEEISPALSFRCASVMVRELGNGGGSFDLAFDDWQRRCFQEGIRRGSAGADGILAEYVMQTRHLRGRFDEIGRA